MFRIKDNVNHDRTGNSEMSGRVTMEIVWLILSRRAQNEVPSQLHST